MSTPEDNLSELFERDPCLCSEQDLVRIIAHMRQHYSQYELGAKVPKAPKPKSTKTDDILKDLGLV